MGFGQLLSKDVLLLLGPILRCEAVLLSLEQILGQSIRELLSSAAKNLEESLTQILMSNFVQLLKLLCEAVLLSPGRILGQSIHGQLSSVAKSLQ
jgi:hypothetical protein